MVDEADLGRFDAVNTLEQLTSNLTHNDEHLTAAGYVLDDSALTGQRIGQNGMKGSDYRFPDPVKKDVYVMTIIAAEDAKFMLQIDYIYPGMVNKIGRSDIVTGFVLVYLEFHLRRIIETPGRRIHSYDDGWMERIMAIKGESQIPGESRYAALARNIASDQDGGSVVGKYFGQE